ncbi:MAG: nucleotidyltransferase domain-containing protein [Ruminococcus sp.]|nr:nucleotidyltransferase domain-containing protein [Ruminococcus sp.]
MNDIYTIEQISDMLFPVFKRYSIENVYLFGSYSRGEATAASDVDLYIPKLPEKMGLEYFGMCDDIEQKLNKSVDIVTDNTGFIDDEEKKDFFVSVKKDRVQIYG